MRCERIKASELNETRMNQRYRVTLAQNESRFSNMKLWNDRIVEATRLFEIELAPDGSFQGLLCPPFDLSIAAYGKAALHLYGGFSGGFNYATVTIRSIDDSGLTIYSQDATRLFLDRFRAFLSEELSNPFQCPDRLIIMSWAAQNQAHADYW